MTSADNTPGRGNSQPTSTTAMRWSYLVLLALHYFSAIAAQCGVPAGLTKIVGGQSVPNLRYPWFVALVSPTSLSTMSVSCGGSLITSRHVLTAAHCFPRNQGDSPEQMYRAVFELVDRCNNPDVPNFALSRVDINPGYNSQTLVGDVAVATLEQSVPYTPVCLPPRNFMKIGEAVIIGFGSTLVKSPYPCTMQEARVNIFSKGQCARSGLAPEYSTLPGTICAGLRRGGVDSCDGDSGGPIQTIGPGGIYTIQGLVSFGEGCARRNLPGVYTQVSAYRDFIDGIISGRRQTTTNPCVNCGPPTSRFYTERKTELYTQRVSPVPVAVGPSPIQPQW
ncbi:transmembrane protease serine 9-like isoform X4 [Homalodisca vitripennis]|uniref:transmembrane protease serine 9-like isoform X4 n=1 Tax=Homalodisca vitripennis TaxID=197043 RepID=UPI001EEC3B54|nr:transmembrane protease serine 9-like isoform X4 [Homalodisca vitripennis]